MLVLLIGCMEYEISQKTDLWSDGDIEENSVFAEDTAAPEPNPDADPNESEDELDPDEVATEQIYVQTKSSLYSWSTENGLEFISYFLDWDNDTPSITDIAIDMQGRMFAVASDRLYQVNPNNADLSYIADLDERLYGLAFTSDGRLFGAGNGLYIVNTTTGALTPFSVDTDYETSGDIVGLPDGRLYWTVTGVNPSAGDDLVIVDPNNGNTAYRGCIGHVDLWGVGYYDGQLFGFSNDGTMAVIDPFSGAASSQTILDGEWWGATTNPVRW